MTTKELIDGLKVAQGESSEDALVVVTIPAEAFGSYGPGFFRVRDVITDSSGDIQILIDPDPVG